MASAEDILEPLAHLAGSAKQQKDEPAEPEFVPAGHRIRVLSRAPEEVPSTHRIVPFPKFGALQAFGTSAVDELLSPARAVTHLLRHDDVRHDPAEIERALRLYAAQSRHPLSSVAGRFAGLLPALALSGAGVGEVAEIPAVAQWLGRLASMGRLGRFAAGGIPLAAQFGGAELIQGRPQEIPYAMTSGLIAGGMAHSLGKPSGRPPVVLDAPGRPSPLALPPGREPLMLPGPPSGPAVATPEEAIPMGYDPYGAFRTGEPPFPVQADVPPEYRVSPPSLGGGPVSAVPTVTREDLLTAGRIRPAGPSFSPGQQALVYDDQVTIVGHSEIPGAYEVKLPSGDVVPVAGKDLRTISPTVQSPAAVEPASVKPLPKLKPRALPKKSVSLYKKQVRER